MSIDNSRGYDLLDQLAEEFAARFRRGERPSLKSYTDRYPELADEIRELFPALIKVEQAEEICQDREESRATTPPLSRVGDYRIVREIGRGGMGVVYEAEQVSLGRRVALKVLPWQVARDRTTLERFRREARASARLHHTNIVPVFEVGQDGEIRYYAMQFIQGQSLDTVIDELQRLRSQSRAELGHRPVLANEVVRSLTAGRIDRDPTAGPAAASAQASPGDSVDCEPLPPATPGHSAVMPDGTLLSSVGSRHRAYHRGVAHIGRQAASALAHAHTRGIVHRDIKPSNLLLDTDGVVWVADFGLAKVDDEDLTRTGDILGTLRYMAPERLRGQGDTRADLYSLGLTLYELLVLRPAFTPSDRVALSEQIKTLDPPRPRSIDPRIPRDLETIVLKAIEKDAGDRYHSADALAEDLRRFLDDEPILARRVGASERYLRWARRNRLIAGLSGVLAAVLIGAMVAAMIVAGRMSALAEVNETAARNERGAKLAAQAALSRAELHRDRAEQSLYIARLNLAENALRQRDTATAAKLLDLYLPHAGATDHRGWEWHYLDRWCRPELRTLRITSATPGTTILSLAMSPDGRTLVASGGNPYVPGPAHQGEPATIRVYELPSLTLRRTLAGVWGRAVSVAFRPDGKRLAIAATEGGIQLWDPQAWRQVRTLVPDGPSLSLPSLKLRGLAWSPDGRLLAVSDASRTWIGNPETGQRVAVFSEPVVSLSWSADGRKIAGASPGSGGFRIWDVASRRLLGSSPGVGRIVSDLFWAAADRLLVFFEDGASLTWNLATGQVREDPGVAQELDDVVFSRDGSFFVTGSNDGLLRIVDTSTRKVTTTLHHGADSITTLALSGDGRRLFAGGRGVPGVKVFDPRRPSGSRTTSVQDQLCAMAFDEGGEALRTINWEHTGDGATIEIHDLARGGTRRGPRLPVTNRVAYPRGDFAFDPQGRQLAAPRNGDDSGVGLWDVLDGREIATLRGSGTVFALAFGAGGTRLATGSRKDLEHPGLLTIWDLSTGSTVRTIDAGPRGIRAVAFSADGRMIAAGGGASHTDGAGWAGVWDAKTGTPLVTLDHAGLIMALAFHPDGTRLVAADFDRKTLHFWDLAAGTEVRRPAPDGVSCLEFTPDGTRLASVGYDGQVHLADARTGEELLILRSAARPPGTGGFTPRLVFSRDGIRLAANALHDLSLWEAGIPTGQEPQAPPADVTDWLRHGRALAARGDAPGAKAAYARARELDDHDPAPWIEHTLVLSRSDDASRVKDAFDRATSDLPDEPWRWVEFGRLLERFHLTHESKTTLEKARSLAERRWSRFPDNQAAAWDLAEALPDPDPSRGWTVLPAEAIASAGGARLTRQPDGSVLADGVNPPIETYTIEVPTGLAGITGLQVEVLPDPSLPNHGPGRFATNGNFILDEIRLSTTTGPGVPTRRLLVRASADYSEQERNLRGVTGAIDGDPITAWSIWPQVGRPHRAVFQTAAPIPTGPGTKLRVELVCGSTRRYYHVLGRFRLSVTDRPVPFFELSLGHLKADRMRKGLTRLGAAYSLLGDWASTASVLERAVARPDTTALDGFLLALARRHLGRPDEARTECDRALERLRADEAPDETHDVAMEALTAVRGLSISECESLWLDAAFPADPFAP